jgi:UPF0755 protein
MTPVKKVALILGVLLLTVLAGALYASYRMNVLLNEEVAVGANGQSFEIRPGMSFTAISEALAAQKIISRPEVLTLYGRITGKASKVRAGEYRIEPGMNMKLVLDQFVAGDVELHSFTIIEGWTFREMLQALARHPAIEHSINHEDWPALLEDFSEGAVDHYPEGLFLPETYRFPRHTPDTEVLRQAYNLMQTTLNEEWNRRAKGLSLDSGYDALILASIVEKETAREDERPRIAGVFVRRLQKGMRLQTDPTVIYGIGEAFNGNLTRRDLRTDTPYNTYTRSGLPPTPIALAGRAAINAALNPADGNELFFVATGNGDGSHKFSATKAQHDLAVQEFLARQRATRRAEQGQ